MGCELIVGGRGHNAAGRPFLRPPGRSLYPRRHDAGTADGKPAFQRHRRGRITVA